MARFYVDLASSPSPKNPGSGSSAAAAEGGARGGGGSGGSGGGGGSGRGGGASGGGGVPACSRLHVLADRVLALAPTLTLSIDAAGRLEVSAQGIGCGVSSRLEGLEVLPPAARRSAEEVDAESSDGNGNGGGGGSGKARVHVASKDLARALSAVAAMNPVRALLGIPILESGGEGEGEGEGNGAANISSSSSVGGHLHIVLAFRDSTGDHGNASSAASNGGGGVDAAVDLSLRVPAVCDDGDDER